MDILSITTAPEATRLPSPMSAPSLTEAPLPMSDQSPTFPAWHSTLWPMTTLSPMNASSSACTTEPSWMQVLLPILMIPASARITVPGHTLEPAPISTSPTT